MEENAHNNEPEGQSLRRLFIIMHLHVFLNLFVHLLANAVVMAATGAAVLLAHCSINLIHLQEESPRKSTMPLVYIVWLEQLA